MNAVPQLQSCFQKTISFLSSSSGVFTICLVLLFFAHAQGFCNSAAVDDTQMEKIALSMVGILYKTWVKLLVLGLTLIFAIITMFKTQSATPLIIWTIIAATYQFGLPFITYISSLKT